MLNRQCDSAKCTENGKRSHFLCFMFFIFIVSVCVPTMYTLTDPIQIQNQI